MKVLTTKTIGLLLLFCGFFTSARAQVVPLGNHDYNKPKLFADLPDKMHFNVSDLEQLLTLPIGASVNSRLNDNFMMVGTVVSKSNPQTSPAQSVVIRMTNRQGATLTFTKTIDHDGGTRYIGRIMSLKNGDAYEVVKENGVYVLQKKNLYDIINE